MVLLRTYRPRFYGQPLNGEQILLVLPIVHKYCMEDMETNIIDGMKKDTSNDGYANLIVASRILGSDELYQAGLKGLTSSGVAPSLAQAKRIGAEATHIAMMKVITAQAITAFQAELAAKPDNRKCRHCHQLTNWTCFLSNCAMSQI